MIFRQENAPQVPPFLERSLGIRVFYYWLVLGIYLIPFIICDFYYMFNDPSPTCNFESIQRFKIAFNIRKWLLVDVYTIIALLSIALITSAMACYSLTRLIYYQVYSVSVNLLGVFRTIWLVVGAIMFWGDLYPRGVCNRSFQRYMWANLIIGLLGTPLYFVCANSYPRVIPIKVPVIGSQTTQRLELRRTPN